MEPIAKANVLIDSTLKTEVSTEPNIKHKTQRKNNSKEQDNKVKGLGDHIPAFLIR